MGGHKFISVSTGPSKIASSHRWHVCKFTLIIPEYRRSCIINFTSLPWEWNSGKLMDSFCHQEAQDQRYDKNRSLSPHLFHIATGFPHICVHPCGIPAEYAESNLSPSLRNSTSGTTTYMKLLRPRWHVFKRFHVACVICDLYVGFRRQQEEEEEEDFNWK